MASWDDDDYDVPTTTTTSIPIAKGKWEGEDEDEQEIPVRPNSGTPKAHDRMNGTQNQKTKIPNQRLLHPHQNPRRA
jgi:hypothetical protein